MFGLLANTLTFGWKVMSIRTFSVFIDDGDFGTFFFLFFFLIRTISATLKNYYTTIKSIYHTVYSNCVTFFV